MFQSIDSDLDPDPKSFPYLIPFVIGFWIAVGMTIMAFFAWMDPQQTLSMSVASHFAAGMAFAFVITIKGILGPITNGYLACYAIYHFATYGEAKLWPLMNWAIGLIVNTNSSTNAVAIYTTVFVVISLFSSGRATSMLDS